MTSTRGRTVRSVTRAVHRCCSMTGGTGSSSYHAGGFAGAQLTVASWEHSIGDWIADHAPAGWVGNLNRVAGSVTPP